MTISNHSPELVKSSTARRAVGLLVAAATVLAAAGYLLALWNPWSLVFLDKYFGNPLFGLFAVSLAAYVTLRLLLPVRNEAVQRGRLRARTIPIVTAVVGLILWGMIGTGFHYEYRELARSDDGTRAVGLVTHRVDDRQHVRVWIGTGFFTRDIGDLGRVCGGVAAHFVTDDLVEIKSHLYDPWQIELDPDTAQPQQRLGPNCPDPPAPID
jgi:hypothetical protein